VTPAAGETERFARQLLLPGLGPAAQGLIRAARVQVVGAGPTGGPALRCLAQAGVGTLYVDDGADVGPGDAGAWLYGAEQAARPRLLAALEALGGAGPLVEVRPHATGVDATAARRPSRWRARRRSGRGSPACRTWWCSATATAVRW
jgi:adenylyltransferase/sulfurtransferase